MPPNPVTTAGVEAAGAPKPVSPLKPVDAGAGELNELDELNPPAAGALNAAGPVDGPAVAVDIPPLFAPANFSCVRPNAATPMIAPIDK